MQVVVSNVYARAFIAPIVSRSSNWSALGGGLATSRWRVGRTCAMTLTVPGLEVVLGPSSRTSSVKTNTVAIGSSL
jgi:hypothetical protein